LKKIKELIRIRNQAQNLTGTSDIGEVVVVVQNLAKSSFQRRQGFHVASTEE